MNALLRKEVYGMQRFFLFFTPIMFFSAIQTQGSYQFIVYVFIVSTFYVMVSNMPDKNVPNGKLLIESLPIKRSTIVLAKYCAPLMWFCLAVLIYIIFAASFTIIPFPALSELVLVFCMLYLYVSLYYPLYYRGGYTFSGVICAPFVLITFISKISYFNLLSIAFDDVLHNPSYLVGLMVLTGILTVISFISSLKIYQKHR